MPHIFARKALLPSGWADDVRLDVRDGQIAAVHPGASPAGEDIHLGVVIPGLANGHSHAFQRALAGRTERRSPQGKDNFWTWRERMYELAGRMDPATLEAIATQAYSEMLESGYTAVAEFHYLHSVEGGDHPAGSMAAAILAAAEHSGVRLTYVPVLYERAGFDTAQPAGHQALFALDLATFVTHFETVAEAAAGKVAVGIGAHSLRAVSPESLERVAGLARQHGIPMHLHIAEQQREVDQCLASYGRRPVRWLLENVAVDESWCLVHATHMDHDETENLAGSGAVVCLCPSTEANLGDGLFPLYDFLRHGGAIAIGSDSHVSINPFEELRWLEYGQRLTLQSRNVAALEDAHVGRELFLRAFAGGARVTGREPAGLEEGAGADLVALYDDDPMLLGHDDASLLDALVFSGYRLPVDRVMVGGEWCVVDGVHVRRQEIRKAFAAALERIGAAR
jgi:formimidoylglutamate deiminase